MIADEILDPEEERDELFEHYRFVADKGQKPLRVDKFIQNFTENTSRNKIQAAAAAGCIHVNRKEVKQNYRVKPGDVVTVVMAHPPREIELIPENIPLEIVYEDEDVVLVNKAAGMVVHPGYGNYTGTLVNAMMYHFNNLPNNNGESRPGLVHRIDKNTSGLLILAKNEFAMSHLSRQFFERTTSRTYVALVWGDMKEDEGTITGNIGRSVRNRKVMDVFPEEDQGKHAVTHFKVLERFTYVTLVECRLETGRTHQIRVHFKYIGHPLFNDEEYGGNRILKGTTSGSYKQFIQNSFNILPRQALHARSLAFDHPVSGKRLEFEVPIPADMQEALERWRTYIKGRQNVG